MKLLNPIYPSSPHRMVNPRVEGKAVPTALVCSNDTFQKSHHKPLRFAGTPIPEDILTSFFSAIYIHNNSESACDMVRNRQISVNDEIREPLNGQPAPTLFEWLLDQHESVELLRAMVQAGANLQKMDRDGHFPIHRVAMLWPPEAVKILVDAGADVNQLDRNGLAPLHYAAANSRALMRQADMVNALVENGAAVDAREPSSGYTPLFVAIDQGHVRSIEALLAHGAQTNTQDTRGKTPLDCALDKAASLRHSGSRTTRYNLSAIVDLLLAHGATFPN